jgi:hypothetical protein
VVLLVLVFVVAGCNAPSAGEPVNNTNESVFTRTESLTVIHDAYLEANFDNRTDIDLVINLLQLGQWVVVERYDPVASPTYMRTDNGEVFEFHTQDGADYDICEVFKEAEIVPYAGIYRIPKDVLPALEQVMNQVGFVTAPGMTGYVMAREDDSILVVESVPQDFSATGGIQEFYSAARFSNAPRDVELGMKVNIWYAMMLDSYPGFSAVEHIEVIPSPKPAGAVLTESEALNRVLISQFFLTARTEDDSGFLANKVMAVKSIGYNAETGSWSISLRDVMAGQESQDVYHFRVDDAQHNGK